MTQPAKAPEVQTDYSSESLFRGSKPEWGGNLADGFVFDVESAFSYFERVKDKRKARGLQYPLAAVLTLCVLGKLSGQTTPAEIADWVRYRAEWLCERLGLTQRIPKGTFGVKKTGQVKMPCAGSYSRILSTSMDTDDLEQVTQAFFAAQSADTHVVEVCLDGKKIRGTISADKPNGEYLLAAYLPGAGVVLMQVLIKAGEGERVN